MADRAPTIPGPDRDPRKPATPLPPGSCDCHAHVFGPQSRYPYAANAQYIPPDATVDDYIRMLTTIGASRAVIVQASVYANDHAAMLDAMRSGRFAFRGVAVVPASVSDRELEDLHAAGVRGVRCNLMSTTPGGTSLDEAPKLAQRIRALGWHLQFYLDINRVADVEDRIAALPVPVIIDHFGHVHAADGTEAPGARRLLALLSRENVWAKLIGAYRISERPPMFPDVTPIARAMVAVAPDRLVWGTDWPHPNAKYVPNCGDLAQMAAEWAPDEAVRRKILVENPARLYQFT